MSLKNKVILWGVFSLFSAIFSLIALVIARLNNVLIGRLLVSIFYPKPVPLMLCLLSGRLKFSPPWGLEQGCDVPMTVVFSKMQGLGNDFVVINTQEQSLNLTPTWIQVLSDRHRGVGCDQVLIIEPHDEPSVDCFYRIFNADGAEVYQCGNGARCVARYFYDRIGITGDTLTLATGRTIMSAKILPDNQICVNMSVPQFEPQAVPLAVKNQAQVYRLILQEEGHLDLAFTALSLGNPHAVLFVDNLDALAVPNLGRLIGRHVLFPEGVNVGFVEVHDRTQIRCRIVERGVGETLACGSGACAAVVAGRLLGLLDEYVSVTLQGGQLSVQWEGEGEPVWMTGPAEYVFDGEYWG